MLATTWNRSSFREYNTMYYKVKTTDNKQIGKSSALIETDWENLLGWWKNPPPPPLGTALNMNYLNWDF